MVHLSVIRNDPTTFKRYLTEQSAVDLEEAVEAKSELVSERQVITFLNEVYKPTDPQNEAVYCLQEVENKEIYQSVISKTECMNKKSEIAFATWCSKRKVSFMGEPFTRKRTMISYINSSVTDICLVAIDFAGLSTNVGDLQNFFNTHKKLKTVLIDKLIYDNEFHEFKREAVLSDPTVLSSFDCRSKPVQRSRKV
ncbi:hypothetical protein HMPREF1544_09782 [Mucor circinelloides 1006PhL]|uniref:Uncharacterized protein n=1 Tax=Mucor circinelloides f. circinelloides (strain 1006PhL) TaxID=1220926 RepID=S2J1I0_MUCC1|nr:hypothetical protein HMPREF1544_09782 [Mucor circinelloides 1006PhL]